MTSLRFRVAGTDILLLIGLVLIGLGNLVLPHSLQEPFGIDYLYIAGTFLVAGIVLRLGRSSASPIPNQWSFLLLVAFTPGIFTSNMTPYGVQKLLTLFIIVLAIQAWSHVRDMQFVVSAFAGASLVLSMLFAGLLYLSPTTNESGRLSVLDLNPIPVSRIVALGSLILFAASLTALTRRRRILSLGLLLGAVAILLIASRTGTRGPLLGAVAAVTIVGLVFAVRRSPLVVVLGIPALTILGIMYMPTILTIVDHDISQGRGTSGRDVLFQLALDSFLNNPLGTGWGDYGLLRGGTSDSAYPHNLLLEAASEGGLIALIIVTSLLIWASVLCCRMILDHFCFASVMVASVYFSSAFNAMVSSDIVGNRLLWIIMGSVPSLYSQLRQNHASGAPLDSRLSAGGGLQRQ